MYTSKNKFFAEALVQCLFIFMIFISSWYENILLDSDGIKIFSIASFTISVDMCVYVYRNLQLKEKI
jgi:hypothetical protein